MLYDRRMLLNIVKKYRKVSVHQKKIRAEGFARKKKIHAQAMSGKKIPANRKFAIPPITFLMVRPLGLTKA